MAVKRPLFHWGRFCEANKLMIRSCIIVFFLFCLLGCVPIPTVEFFPLMGDRLGPTELRIQNQYEEDLVIEFLHAPILYSARIDVPAKSEVIVNARTSAPIDSPNYSIAGVFLSADATVIVSRPTGEVLFEEQGNELFVRTESFDHFTRLDPITRLIIDDGITVYYYSERTKKAKPEWVHHKTPGL